jgi:hypothetical protein
VIDLPADHLRMLNTTLKNSVSKEEVSENETTFTDVIVLALEESISISQTPSTRPTSPTGPEVPAFEREMVHAHGLVS